VSLSDSPIGHVTGTAAGGLRWSEHGVSGTGQAWNVARPQYGGAVAADDAPGSRGGLPSGQQPGHPPGLLRPVQLDLLFTAGTRFVCDPENTVIAEVLPAGMLRMPSGRLIAADPGWIDFECQPFTEAVPPGEYPVLVSVVRWVDDLEERVAAAKLAIRSDPVVSWELALLPGQDPQTLPEGGYFGFAVDTARAGLFDAVAVPALARIFADDTWDDTGFGWRVLVDMFGDKVTGEFSDPDSGANLIAFETGWGDGAYPTWIGRSASGDIACFVAEMHVLGDNPVPDPG
jgi:Protein of unknown function (DUF4241)